MGYTRPVLVALATVALVVLWLQAGSSATDAAPFDAPTPTRPFQRDVLSPRTHVDPRRAAIVAGIDVDHPRSPSAHLSGAVESAHSLADALQRHGTNVLQLHDCAAAFSHASLWHSDGLQLLLRKGIRRQVSTLRFCSITSTFASQLQHKMTDLSHFRSSWPNRTNVACTHEVLPGTSTSGRFAFHPPMLSVGILERPQHAMQFLFSLLGVTAMQDSYGFNTTRDIAAVAVATYGQFQQFADVKDLHRYPHMELLQLLSERGVAVVHVPGVGFATVKPPEPKDSWIRPPAHIDSEFPLCFGLGLFGSLPARVLHYKKQESHRHAIRPHHFTNFRDRLIRHFAIPVVEDPRHRNVLIISRAKQKRRLIVNEQALVKLVEGIGMGYAPVVVDWEGMPLRDQLRLALNANAIIGVHGNGHVWDCFMPEGSLMIEISSTIQERNEVKGGRNRRNVGNLAGVCPIESYSFLCEAVETEFSLRAPATRKWKEVNVVVSELQLRRMQEVLREHRDKVMRDAQSKGLFEHVAKG